MRKTLKILLGAIIVLFLIFFFLVTTRPGLKTSIFLARHLAPGQLNIAYSDGRLTGPLTIDGFTYRNKNTYIHFTELKLDWRAADLLIGRLNIKTLYLYRLKVHLPKPTQKEATSFSLPMQFTLKNIDLHDIQFSQGGGKPTKIQTIKADAKSSGRRLTINELRIEMRPYTLTTKGYLTLGRNYATNLTGRLTDHVRFFSDVNLNYTLKGNIDKATFNAKTEPPFKAKLTATLTKPLKHGPININGDWEKIIWPLDSGHYISVSNGHIHVTGTLKNYRFNMTSNIDGSQIPSMQWRLNGDGSWQQLHLSSLHANLLSGQINGNAKLNWQRPLTWQINLTGTHLNPAVEWRNWPGNINFTLTSQGSSLKQFTAHFTTSGSLNQQPLSGDVKLNYKKHTLSIPDAKLNVGSNQLNAHGYLNKYLDLRWKANLRNLSEISKDTSGSVVSQGHFYGKTKVPSLDGSLDVINLKFAGLNIASLNANSQFNLQANKTSRFAITGKQIDYKQFNLTTFSANFSGDLLHHKITGNFNMPQGDLSLKLNGGYREELWRGQLTQLNFTSRKYYNWHLQKTVDLTLGKKIDVSNFCWQSPQSSICGGGDYKDPQHWKLDANIRHFDVSMLQELMPSDLHLTTNLNAKINLERGKDSETQGTANIDLKSANLTYLLAKKQHHLYLSNSNLYAKLNQKGLSSELYLQDRDKLLSLTAKFNLPKYLGRGLPDLANPVNGTLKANLKTLNFLSSLLPEVTSPGGRLQANLALSGTLSSPRIKGRLNLARGHIAIQKYGLNLTNIQLLATANSTNIKLNGQVNSGGHILKITGNVPIKSNFSPSTFTLKGDNVLVINQKAYQIYASPNLKIRYDQPNLNIEGSVLIPKAKIAPKDFTSTVTLPDNVRVIRGDKNEDLVSETKLRLKIKVSLGKDVYVASSGLFANLGGEVTVDMSPNQLTTAAGSLKVTKGFYQAHDNRLNIKDGVLLFTGGPIDNPGLNILAVKTVEVATPGQALQDSDVIVGVQVTGTAQDPQVKLYSNPTLSSASTLSYLLFGQATDTMSGAKWQVLSQAASKMGLSGGGLTGDFKSKLGLTAFGVESNQVVNPSTGQTEQNTSFVVGKRLTRHLSLSYSIGILIPVSILKIRYRLSKSWVAQTDTSTYGSGADIFYTYERN